MTPKKNARSKARKKKTPKSHVVAMTRHALSSPTAPSVERHVTAMAQHWVERYLMYAPHPCDAPQRTERMRRRLADYDVKAYYGYAGCSGPVLRRGLRLGRKLLRACPDCGNEICLCVRDWNELNQDYANGVVGP